MPAWLILSRRAMAQSGQSWRPLVEVRRHLAEALATEASHPGALATREPLRLARAALARFRAHVGERDGPFADELRRAPWLQTRIAVLREEADRIASGLQELADGRLPLRAGRPTGFRDALTGLLAAVGTLAGHEYRLVFDALDEPPAID